jgi:hypothetical protein
MFVIEEDTKTPNAVGEIVMRTAVWGPVLVILGAILTLPSLVNPAPVSVASTGVDRQLQTARPSPREGRHSAAGLLAILVVASGLLGAPLAGQRLPALVELRHNILMIDKEFDRSSMRKSAVLARAAASVAPGVASRKAQSREAAL